MGAKIRTASANLYHGFLFVLASLEVSEMFMTNIQMLTLLAAALLACFEVVGANAGAQFILLARSGSPDLAQGIPIGSITPAFIGVDQFGKRQTNETIAGKNGLILFFFRSADWSPFCKTQLVRLQAAQQTFRNHGIGVAAVSYDTQTILKDFAERQHITIPLVADPNSEIIQRFNALESQPVVKGIAHPGYIYIGPDGRAKENFFEAFYADTYTPNSLFGKLFPESTELIEEPRRILDASHINLTVGQSDRNVSPGNLLTLSVDIILDHGMYVYGPGARGHISIELDLEPNWKLMATSASYPTPKNLFLKSAKEQSRIYDGQFRITQDIKILYEKTFLDSLKETRKILISGLLKYQPCDMKTCYPPVSVPIQWEVQVMQLELQRSPREIQHDQNYRSGPA